MCNCVDYASVCCLSVDVYAALVVLCACCLAVLSVGRWVSLAVCTSADEIVAGAAPAVWVMRM